MIEPLDGFLVRLTTHDEEGQGMLEYALIITFVALVVIAALFILGPKVGNMFNESGSQLLW